jgi:sugar phosphate isomerase/epimerase
MASLRHPQVSRRDFIRLGAAGAAALCVGRFAPLAWAAAGKKIPVALQLYSVRDDCDKDLPKTLEAVAKMGYVGVEFAGYYGRDAKALRELLDANGLVCCGTHTGIDTLLGDALKKTVEFHQTLGNKFLICPGLPGEYTKSHQAWLDTAKVFNEIAAKAKADGMRVGYHNHSAEFKPMDGEAPWDTLFSNTKPEVVMQLDTGNAMGGGGDPVAILKKYPGRAATVHLKEHGGSGDFGDGDMKWKEVFNLCETTGGTAWYIIEQESGKGAPLDCVQQCVDFMKKMGKV